jgi:hypothetical protein
MEDGRRELPLSPIAISIIAASQHRIIAASQHRTVAVFGICTCDAFVVPARL